MKNQVLNTKRTGAKTAKRSTDYLLSDDAFYLFALAVKYKKLCGAKALQDLLTQGTHQSLQNRR